MCGTAPVATSLASLPGPTFNFSANILYLIILWFQAYTSVFNECENLSIIIRVFLD